MTEAPHLRKSAPEAGGSDMAFATCQSHNVAFAGTDAHQSSANADAIGRPGAGSSFDLPVS